MWLTWKGKDGYGGGGGYLPIKIFYFLLTKKKNTGKMARAQGKHGEFGINWSVATLMMISRKRRHIQVNLFQIFFPLYII